MNTEIRKCLDCGTEFEPLGYQLYCDSMCALRSNTRIPACGDLLCNHLAEDPSHDTGLNAEAY